MLRFVDLFLIVPISYLKLFFKSFQLANTAVSALCNLACYDQSQVVMKTQGIFGPLLKLLLHPEPSPNVIRVLWNLSCGTQNRQALANSNFVPALIQVNWLMLLSLLVG